MTIFSIGHSTHTAEKFGAMLASAHIDVLWDIRSHPTSKWEQHRFESMKRWLPSQFGVGYYWEPGLGGWDVRHADDPALNARMAAVGVDLNVYSKGKFPKQRIAPDRSGVPEGSPAWTNQGLYDYSWFTGLDEFGAALHQLMDAAKTSNIAIMCCEALWWKCHRSMVADAIVWHGGDVTHIPFNKSHTAALGNRLERYDRQIIEAWREQGEKFHD